MAERRKAGGCQKLVVTGCLGGALSRRTAGADPGDRCRPWHRRSTGHRRGPGWAGVLSIVLRCAPAGHQCPRDAVSTQKRVTSRSGPHRASTYIYDAAHRGSWRHLSALRVHQGSRRLRLPLFVLHHPAPARTLPEPAHRLDCPGGARAGGARRTGNRAHQPGHDVLRRGPRSARCTGATAPRVEWHRRTRVDPDSLPLPDNHHGRDARRHGGVREGRQIR